MTSLDRETGKKQKAATAPLGITVASEDQSPESASTWRRSDMARPRDRPWNLSTISHFFRMASCTWCSQEDAVKVKVVETHQQGKRGSRTVMLNVGLPGSAVTCSILQPVTVWPAADVYSLLMQMLSK